MKNKKKIAIVGTGYVGLVSGACFASWGHDVTCIDIDAARIALLKQGKAPIFEPGLEELVACGLQEGRLHFTTCLTEAVAGAEVIFIAVGTPSGPYDGEADLEQVFNAGRQIAAALTGPAVIVTKSTVPVGTSERIETVMRSVRSDLQFFIASNPEFLREGSALDDFNMPDRTVIGIDSEYARRVLFELYQPLADIGVPILVTERRSAELVKYASNAFLATKITFINEIADLCEKVGAKVDEISLGMGMDKRIGAAFLKAGPGYGGSCFPKDTLALLRTAQEFGVSMRLVEETIASNSARKRNLVNRIRDLLDGYLRYKKVAVLGLTFKANTDDMRDSPTLPLINSLLGAGVVVSAYDPCGIPNARRLLRDVNYCDDPYECARGADAIILMTDWSCFNHIDFRQLSRIMRRRVLLDLRGIYDPEDIAKKYGFAVQRVGYPSTFRSDQSRSTTKRRARKTLVSVDTDGALVLPIAHLGQLNSTENGKDLSQ